MGNCITLLKLRLPQVSEPQILIEKRVSTELNLQTFQTIQGRTGILPPEASEIKVNLLENHSNEIKMNLLENKVNLLEIATGKRNSFRSITHNDEGGRRREEGGGRRKEEGGEEGGRKIQLDELKISPSFSLKIRKVIMEKRGKGGGKRRERGWRSISLEEGGRGRREDEEEEREVEEEEVRTKEEINSGFMRQKKEIEENQRKLREMQRARIEKGRKKDGGGNYKKKPKYANLKIKIKEEEDPILNEKPKKSLLKRVKSEKNLGRKKVRFLDLEIKKKKKRNHE